jgi:hypothetical protein
MSNEVNLNKVTMEAGSDLSAAQYKFVSMASDTQVDVVGTKGAVAIGVLLDKPAAAGRAASVAIGGVCKVAAGAAVAAGAEVISDATGRAIATDAADQYILGTAIEAAAAAGNVIAVRLKNYMRSA